MDIFEDAGQNVDEPLDHELALGPSPAGSPIPRDPPPTGPEPRPHEGKEQENLEQVRTSVRQRRRDRPRSRSAKRNRNASSQYVQIVHYLASMKYNKNNILISRLFSERCYNSGVRGHIRRERRSRR